jgi:photosystem II stability/assembly factor-like uncharacterized protein
MNIRLKQGNIIVQNLWILISLSLLCSCSTDLDTIRTVTSMPSIPTEAMMPSPAAMPGSWQVVGVYNADHSIMTAGFLDEKYVVTGGVMGQMAYSSDSAETWLITDSRADCRYGIEIVSPQMIWTCGGATHVRKSVDAGRTWSVLAGFGDPHSIRGPCHSLSFLDENIGWLANSNMFGTTLDGGVSWTMRPLPELAQKIATIDTYRPGEGYLLDQSGVLFFTEDDGGHWREASRLQLGALEMSFSVYQLAAMRFSDAEHGLIVVSSGDSGRAEPVLAFHTYDGGQSWVSEVVPVLAGPVYLSREGGFLSVITAYGQLTLLRYEE